jgi:uncharacterized protein YegL
VDVAIMEFNSEVKLVQNFSPLQDMTTPTLEAKGCTAMGSAIENAIELITARRQFYKDEGIMYHPAHIFMITDGAPTDKNGKVDNDSIDSARKLIKKEEEARHLKFFVIGVSGYDAELMGTLTNRVISLDAPNFKSIFTWLSASMKAVSNSHPGDPSSMVLLPADANVYKKVPD